MPLCRKHFRICIQFFRQFFVRFGKNAAPRRAQRRRHRPGRAGEVLSCIQQAGISMPESALFCLFFGHFLQSKRFIFVQSVQVCRNRAVFRHRAAGFAAGPFPAQRRAEAAEMRPRLVYRSWNFLAAGIDIRLCTGYNGWYTAAADFRQRRKGAHGSTAEYR